MKKYILLLLIFGNQWIWSQVQFEAKVSRTTLGLNERLRVDFTMNADGDHFTPPQFNGFRVIGGPNQSVSYSWVNGKQSFHKTYSYFLLPLQKGSLVIKQATIEVDNEIYKTVPITVNVTAAVDTSKDPDSPEYMAKESIQLVAEVSKTDPYINEPITVVYKMYFNNVGIDDWKELESPRYNDFWSQNIEIKKLEVEEGIYNGEKTRYVVLRKTVLYPQKSGKLTIEPLTFDLALQIPTNRRDIFGGVLLTRTNRTVTTGSKTINVKPLPEQDKPEDFSGAVGQFTFDVKASKIKLKQGESLDLNLSISGKGNLKLFHLPKPTLPSSLEMYEPIHHEKITTTLSGMQGTVSDQYTLIPQSKGDYSIKPLRFSYFDPASKTYKNIWSPEILIQVLEGATGTSSIINNTSKEESQPLKKLVESGDQFHFIRLKTHLYPIEKQDFFESGLFYFLLFLPFIVLPILVFAKKKKDSLDGDIIGNRTRLSNRLAKRYLSEAKKQINNRAQFYIVLEKAMHNFLKAKLSIETSEMNKETIRTLLLSKKANSDSVETFIALMESCDLARYALVSDGSIQKDYNKAIAILSELEKQI